MTNSNKPRLRVIHHFACSGGTLVSKCIAALPNVFLLSELHPSSTLHISRGKPRYLPSDIATQSRYAEVPNVQELANNIFKDSICLANEHIEAHGGNLVIRDHSHADFCVGETIAKKSEIVTLLKTEFNVLSVVTIRNPIDAYASLVKNNWVHFSPATFDEYCKRFWAFVSNYDDEVIFKYEDFVAKPEKVLKKIAKTIELDFDSSAIDIFSVFQVTGDSGRSGSYIEKRDRKELDEDFLKEIQSSEYFKKITKRFRYKP